MRKFLLKNLIQNIFALSLISLSLSAFANDAALAQLEAASGVTLGIFALNTANNQTIQYHADQRFPMGCTSKLIGVAAVLKQSETDPTLLQQKIPYTKKDIVEWSPVTKKHLSEGRMSVKDLCAAAIEYSDNAAMNLLIEKIGGLSVVNNFARSIGNTKFRLDHEYPREALVSNLQDVQDSDTPTTMTESLNKLVLGNILAPPEKQLLETWLKGAVTGEKRIKAGVPKNWVVGHKTGTGFDYGITNDIALIWPPKCAPIVLTIFTHQTKKDAAPRDDILAEATGIVIKQFAQQDSCIPLESENTEHSVQTNVLQRFDLPETNYHGGMGISIFKPNEAHTKHMKSGSSGPEVLYVLEGEIQFQPIGSGQNNPTLIKKGESFLIPADLPHVTQAGPKGAKVLAVWVLKNPAAA